MVRCAKVYREESQRLLGETQRLQGAVEQLDMAKQLAAEQQGLLKGYYAAKTRLEEERSTLQNANSALDFRNAQLTFDLDNKTAAADLQVELRPNPLTTRAFPFQAKETQSRLLQLEKEDAALRASLQEVQSDALSSKAELEGRVAQLQLEVGMALASAMA